MQLVMSSSHDHGFASTLFDLVKDELHLDLDKSLYELCSHRLFHLYEAAVSDQGFEEPQENRMPSPVSIMQSFSPLSPDRKATKRTVIQESPPTSRRLHYNVKEDSPKRHVKKRRNVFGDDDDDE